MLDLEPIKARADAATGGPWTAGGPYMREHEVTIAKRLPMVDLTCDDEGRANAEFIAHAREDIPALVAEVERLRAAQEHERVVARPGDTLIIRVNPNITAEQVQRFQEQAEQELPDIQVFIIAAEQIAVVSRENGQP